MPGKLLSLLTTAKGASAAAVIAAGALGTGVVATNTDVQNAIAGVTRSVTSPNPDRSGQPAVVAARNDADKTLREAFQKDQQALEKLRSTKVDPRDRAKLDDAVKAADEKLRARLTKALDDVAALTLGREGRESASPKPSASPDVKVSFGPDAQTKVDAVVKAAVRDMDAIVADAAKAVAGLPTTDPGRPSEPGGRPSDAGRPSDRPSPAAPARPSPTR